MGGGQDLRVDKTQAEKEAWAVLQAVGVRPRTEKAVTEAGGPQELLRWPPSALYSWLERHIGRHRRRTPEGVAVRMEQASGRLSEFVGGGGRLLGAPAHGELGRLRAVQDPRLILFAVGPADMLVTRRAVAIVGTRQASPQACRRAFDLAGTLARAGVVVVSGGARGIDLHAHQGALQAGGSTIEVVGEPLGHRAIGRYGRVRGSPERVLKLIVHGPEVAPGAWLFAQRNRFIAAAADALVVVAGDVDSGARHAAHAAHKMQRKLRVFPGDIDDRQSKLANQLLATTSARPFQGAEELLAVLGLAAPLRAAEEGGAETPLLAALTSGPLTVDEAAEALGVTVQDVVMQALELEMTGRLLRLGGRLART